MFSWVELDPKFGILAFSAIFVLFVEFWSFSRAGGYFFGKSEKLFFPQLLYTIRQLKNFGFIDKSHFCFFQLTLFLVSNCPTCHYGVKLSEVSNCPRCQIVLGVKLT